MTRPTSPPRPLRALLDAYYAGATTRADEAELTRRLAEADPLPDDLRADAALLAALADLGESVRTDARRAGDAQMPPDLERRIAARLGLPSPDDTAPPDAAPTPDAAPAVSLLQSDKEETTPAVSLLQSDKEETAPVEPPAQPAKAQAIGQASAPRPGRRLGWPTWRIAAGVALALTLGGVGLHRATRRPTFTDTCQTTDEARLQMERALTLIAGHSRDALDRAESQAGRWSPPADGLSPYVTLH